MGLPYAVPASGYPIGKCKNLLVAFFALDLAQVARLVEPLLLVLFEVVLSPIDRLDQVRPVVIRIESDSLPYI